MRKRNNCPITMCDYKNVYTTRSGSIVIFVKEIAEEPFPCGSEKCDENTGIPNAVCNAEPLVQM